YFFFQAEDGIRDFHVTGVQTCALPISATPSRPSPPARAGTPAPGRASATTCCRSRRRPDCSRRPPSLPPPNIPSPAGGGGPGWRSEERRVGKEGRTRGCTTERNLTRRP